MDKRRFADTNEFFSLLGFGCMRFPTTADKAIDEAAARDMLDYAMESGVNYIDTAYFYHEDRSEDFVGRSLAGRARDSYYLATKLPLWLTENEDDVERIFFEQLKRLRVEYLDHYLLHNLDTENADVARKYKAMEKLQRFKEQGLIRRIGMSFHDTAEVLERHIAEFDVEFVYLQLNYMDWELQNAKGQYEVVTKACLPVIVMEPVRGGGLASLCERSIALLRGVEPDKTPASWALRFAASLPSVVTVLSGMSSMEQVRDNVATMTDFKPLSEADKSVLDEALKIYVSSGAIPCTSCRYCEDCPKSIDIPTLFTTYNQYKTTGSKAKFMNTYDFIEEGRRAHDCVSCGKCEALCPQSIKIPEYMEKIADLAKELCV